MLTLFFAYLMMSIPANAQVRFAPVEGQYQAKGDYQYLTTSANYPGDGGSSVGLISGNRYTRMLGEGEITFDLSPALRFWGGFNGGQSTAGVIDAVSGLSKTVTNSGLNEGYLGAQWWTEFQHFDIVPQADFIFPFQRVDQNSPNPLLGEDALQFQFGSWAMYPMPGTLLTPFVYLGIDYRDGGRSMLLPYSVGARYGTPERFWIQAEFRGYQSLTDDNNVNSLLYRDGYLLGVDGGSYEFYAINPSRAEIAGMLGYSFDQLCVYAGGAKTMFGRVSADDYRFIIGVTFTGRLFSKAPARVLPAQKLDEKSDKYDDSLFKDQITPDPESVYEPEVVVPPPAPKKPARKSKAGKPAADAPMPDVELLMKDTQKNLEKKAH